MLACRAALNRSIAITCMRLDARRTLPAQSPVPRLRLDVSLVTSRVSLCCRARVCVPGRHVWLGCRFVRKEKKETVSTIRSLTDGRCTGYPSDWPRPLPIYFLFTRSTLGHSRRPESL